MNERGRRELRCANCGGVLQTLSKPMLWVGNALYHDDKAACARMAGIRAGELNESIRYYRSRNWTEGQ